MNFTIDEQTDLHIALSFRDKTLDELRELTFTYGQLHDTLRTLVSQNRQLMESKPKPFNPCPFCGEEEDIKLSIYKGSDKTVDWSYCAVNCRSCGISGPNTDFDDGNYQDQDLAEANAIAYWNGRTYEEYEITKSLEPKRD